MNHISENSLYESIRNSVAEAQQKVYATVNFVMVETGISVNKFMRFKVRMNVPSMGQDC